MKQSFGKTDTVKGKKLTLPLKSCLVPRRRQKREREMEGEYIRWGPQMIDSKINLFSVFTIQ